MARKRRDEIAAMRLHTRTVGALPLDRERAAVELTEERRALFSSSPRKRRWRALEKLDREVDRLTQRHAEALARLHEAEQQLAEAPEHDARTLARWVEGGHPGERRGATVYERERERDAAKLLVDAVVLELDRALERRVEHVKRNRKKMLADARRDVDEARRRLAERVSTLGPLRDELLAARETLLWAAAFPEPVEAYGFPTALALGLREPVNRTLQTTVRLDYGGVLTALEEDATAIAEAFSSEQKRQLGVAEPRTPVTEAMWSEDEDYKTWQQAELERARKLAEWHDPNRLAAEIREPR